MFSSGLNTEPANHHPDIHALHRRRKGVHQDTVPRAPSCLECEILTLALWARPRCMELARHGNNENKSQRCPFLRFAAPPLVMLCEWVHRCEAVCLQVGCPFLPEYVF